MDLQNIDIATLELFPAEIWELFIGKIDNTEDILNFIKAFPEVPVLRKRRQFSVLIGEMMPLIMCKLTVDDILSCRLVSKRWKDSVETSLETHPDRHSYKSTRSYLSEHQINYAPVPMISTNLGKFLDCECANTTRDPVTKNPFPGRHVSATVKIPNNNNKQYINLEEILRVIRMVGEHVWFLNVKLILDNPTEESFILEGLLPLFDCLSLLPNLHSLKIRATGLAWSMPTCKLSTAILQATSPFQLESLDLLQFTGMPADIYGIFIKSFGCCNGIQKLSISTKDWKESYAAYFPNITDISIKTNQENDLSTLLSSLPSPHLLKKLKFDCDVVDICKLLEYLGNSQFQLESLEIKSFGVGDDSWKGSTLLTTIQDLKLISASNLCLLKFEFLKALTELKYLTICDLRWLEPSFNDEAFNANKTFRTATAKSVYNFVIDNKLDWNNFAGIWEELPKLKILMCIDNNTSYNYARECKGNIFLNFRRY